ncbi:SDR family oxidoreductase [Haliangium ochraceum]|uniref:Short-chain dehydrogenase/reductase SDR n=1 Tax=Haliangium ochraceum (strain DSM 14365 / JCM 11303 / SMP-2) TaxID=502025 RepID=D0LNW0_HALO1|nr:SDR family oxidoreductase [Haliangium ochraceum]ACY18786.1 short-chain dehydrogenase/reductase SDR [Haliangium ochraceum DSM 14365]
MTESKTILITGASSGIGAACARSAAEAGHRLVLAARSADKLGGLVDELGAERALAVACDVTDPDAQASMFERAVERFGGLDVVFANAGIGAKATGTEHGDIDNFRQLVLVNNFAVAVTCKLAIPHLKRRKGHLLLTGSKAGHNALSGSVYSATKWFIRGYAKNLANELSEHGVRVTSIDPGMVDTPFFDEAKPDALRPEDIGRAFVYAIEQPAHVHVADIEIYPMPSQ